MLTFLVAHAGDAAIRSTRIHPSRFILLKPPKIPRTSRLEATQEGRIRAGGLSESGPASSPCRSVFLLLTGILTEESQKPESAILRGNKLFHVFQRLHREEEFGVFPAGEYQGTSNP